MSKALDDLLTQLPQWLGKITQSLTHPSQVLNEQLTMASAPQTDGKPEAKPVPDGVSFLILSFAVAAGVSIAFPVPSMAPLEAVQADRALTNVDLAEPVMARSSKLIIGQSPMAC